MVLTYTWDVLKQKKFLKSSKKDKFLTYTWDVLKPNYITDVDLDFDFNLYMRCIETIKLGN